MDNGKLVAVVAICVAACGSPAGVGAEPTDAVAGARADHGALTMRVARASHSAVALPDGRALLIGGCVRESCEAGPDSRTADVFDPRTQRFELAGTLQTPRVSTTAVDLPGGRLLLAGGWAGSSVTDSTEIFDWRSGRSIRGPNLSSARADMAAASLPDGRVILAGGYDGRGATDAIDLYDPSDRSLRRIGSLSTARAGAGAALLPNGKVLIVGGGASGPSGLRPTRRLKSSTRRRERPKRPEAWPVRATSTR